MAKELSLEDMDREIRNTYTRVVSAPVEGSFHFHLGADFASRVLQYSKEDLSPLPSENTKRFCGVGNPHACGEVRVGESVLDHACGSGTDLLLAARKVGPTGRVVGVDLLDEMVTLAENGAKELGLENVQVKQGNMLSLPAEDNSFDVVMSNGTLNLVMNKTQAVREIHRVLKPGGRLHLADVFISRPLSEKARSDPELWAAGGTHT